MPEVFALIKNVGKPYDSEEKTKAPDRMYTSRFNVLLALSLLSCLEAKAQTPPTIATLEVRVDALQATVADLQKQLVQVEANNAAQSAALATLQKQVTLIAQNPALAPTPR